MIFCAHCTQTCVSDNDLRNYIIACMFWTFTNWFATSFPHFESKTTGSTHSDEVLEQEWCIKNAFHIATLGASRILLLANLNNIDFTTGHRSESKVFILWWLKSSTVSWSIVHCISSVMHLLNINYWHTNQSESANNNYL